MSIPKYRLELPPEAEPARDFIEALVARCESQITELKHQVQSLSEQIQSLTEWLQKPNPRNSLFPPSSQHPHGKPPRKPSKRRIRKQGGQEGHKRHLRELVPIEQCGPRLAAITGLLMGHFRQSKRRVSSFLRDLLNIPCSPARTIKIQNLVSDALSEPYCQLQTELANQSQLYVDESPTKQH